jgi:hypothetical protein
MSGLLRRLSRDRAATDDEATPSANGASETVDAASPDAQPGGQQPVPAGSTAAADAPTTVQPAAGGAAPDTAPETPPDETPGRDLPAGVDVDTLAAVPETSASRAKLRRRLRYLRHARELLLRDLGGFYAEAHRSEAGPEAHRRLLDVKARRIATLDGEVRELEQRLDEPHGEVVIREPGIGGTCPACGELHGSEARFCSRCGTALTGAGRRGAAATPAGAATGTGTATGAGQPAGGAERMTTASLWGRSRVPAGDRPAGPPTQADQLTQAVEPAGEPGRGEDAGSQAAGQASPAPDEPRDPAEPRDPEEAPPATAEERRA